MGPIKGVLVSGKEEGAFFTGLDWVKEQCLEKLGFEPYAGTLNLKVTEGDFSQVKALAIEKGVRLVPPTAEFCEAMCLRIRMGDDIEGAVILPIVGSYYEDIVEIIAPIKVKDRLKLKEGDEVVFDLG